MRVATVILALILACGPPASVPAADPIASEGAARPSVRGNRLIASSSDRVVQPLAVEVTSPVVPGDTATANAVGRPGSRCTIEVTYRSGLSEAQGLDPATAGEDGSVSWTWIVGINTTPGDWVVAVECVEVEGRRATGRAVLAVEGADPAAPTDSAGGGQ